MATNQEASSKKKTNPLFIIVIVIVVIILLGFLLTFASSIFFASKISQALKKNGVQYSAGNNSFVYKDKSGNTAVVGSTAKLPANFPKDFPIYLGAKVVSAITIGTTFSVTFTMEGTKVADVLKWYGENMAANGWKADPSSPGAQLLHFEKGNMSAILIFVYENNNTLLKATISSK